MTQGKWPWLETFLPDGWRLLKCFTRSACLSIAHEVRQSLGFAWSAKRNPAKVLLP